MDTKVEGPDPLLGSKVAGRYTVMKRIAKGGMGVVYLAVQDGLGRAVALKIIRKEAAADPVMQKRFEREAKEVSSLGHPSIVTVHDFGRTDNGELFLAMEFVDGDVLRDVIKRKKRLSFVESLPIIESITAALARAHAAGVVHRDLKPENVILPRQSATTTGAVAAKVLDFGLAKRHDPEQVAEHLTRDGGFVGTPGYASPEQTEGLPEHPRQDLYALGIMWFELLVGEHPFAAPTPMKIVVRQLNEEAPSLEGKLDDVPNAAAALIRKLMARDADNRPESAQAVLDELAQLKAAARVGGGAPAAAAAVAAAPSPPREGQHPTRSERVPTPAAPSLAPAVSAGASAQQQQQQQQQPVAAPSRAGLFVVVGALLAAGAGAGLVYFAQPPRPAVDAGALGALVDTSDGRPGDPPDALVGVAVDAGPPPVQIVLESVPTFTALQALRDALPKSTLDVYSRERSVLLVPGGEAPTLAELLQGRALIGDLPLVLEVKELTGASITVAAVRPEDASALADAGLLLDGGAIADAGPVSDVTAPGGLAP